MVSSTGPGFKVLGLSLWSLHVLFLGLHVFSHSPKTCFLMVIAELLNSCLSLIVILQ